MLGRQKIMTKLKIAILFSLINITCYSCRFPKLTFTPGYTEKECQQIEANLDKFKIGMDRIEVISLIGKESGDIIHLNPGMFPEQKTKWEVWRLCVDPKSCMFVESLGKEWCHESYMVAFDLETGKLIKVFSDDPEMTGFF